MRGRKTSWHFDWRAKVFPNLNCCNISKSRVLGSLQVVLEKMQGCWFKDVCLRRFAVQLESESYVQIFAVSTSEREITKDPHKQVMYQRFLNLEGASGVSTHKYKSAQVDYMQNIY